LFLSGGLGLGTEKPELANGDEKVVLAWNEASPKVENHDP
jgi:hypothetical protein